MLVSTAAFVERYSQQDSLTDRADTKVYHDSMMENHAEPSAMQQIKINMQLCYFLTTHLTSIEAITVAELSVARPTPAINAAHKTKRA